MEKIILLSHGDGGILTRDLVKETFLRHLQNEYLEPMADSALLDLAPGRLVVSTDSFVVSPLFFPGGDIGKLAVCGTVNDIAVCGGIPRYLTAAFILEEGLPVSCLEKIVSSLARAAREAGVEVIAGDTKVVERGHGDQVFINTTGFGSLLPGIDLGYHRVEPGDHILVSGTVGDHGLTVFARQQELDTGEGLSSDCAPLNGIIRKALEQFPGLKILRDPTRGGLATTLKEVAEAAGRDFLIFQDRVPLKEEVHSWGEMLGLDPLYLANEGKFIAVVAEDQAGGLKDFLRQEPLGKDAEIIGRVTGGRGRVLLKTPLGGTRQLGYLAGAPLPRIC